MDKKKILEDSVDFSLEEAVSISSSSIAGKAVIDAEEVFQEDAAEDASPVFKLLSAPKLPAMSRRDRATLLMQSPTRLYFYWSVATNPFRNLEKAIGGSAGNYTLVVKLRNLSAGTETLNRVDPSGNWWFDVESDATYRAEIGFYAPGRPFVRIVFSNVVKTPRKSPSRRTDYTPSFTVSAGEFSRALDAAGFRRDAFDVALAGDDQDHALESTRLSFKAMTGFDLPELGNRHESDLRFVLMALAAGHSLEEIRHLVSAELFSMIADYLEGVGSETAMSALEEFFDVVPGEVLEEQVTGAAVFGLSLVHFPQSVRKRRIPRSLLPKLAELANQSGVSSESFV
ncbi:MAG: DUF4912 domain-containing protein [Pyrinomonadaceae bacterium]